ncbi:UNVERIFIED_CONTAM: hypothetical protein GTU68_045177 [Idotea baltica]|nr:hypothetical protein [Idotea baltica]
MKKQWEVIHVKGGTIIGTTNKAGPFSWPVEQPDGTWVEEDRSEFLIQKLNELGIDAVISIGGDGSQKISQKLFERGVNIVGVPKTIDNDLSATDYTFGFQTAVQVATEGFDKLVTTAESHSRVMIMEVMGRDAGWIALHTAIAGGAEVCLIPEVPYDIDKVVERIEKRFQNRRGFANIVIAEGAFPKGGSVVSNEIQQGGITASCRVTVLGHLQRGGTPIAFDRILATQFGVKAFEMVLDGNFGKMTTYKNNTIGEVSLKEATESYNVVQKDSFLVRTARGIGISLGD